MKRKKPSFNETYHGYRTFSELLEDAQTQGLLELETDKRSRTYVVTRFGSEMTSKPAVRERSIDGADRPVRRRKRGSGRGRRTRESAPAAVEAGNPAPPPVEDETERERPLPKPAREKSGNVWSAATELGLDADEH
jgi:hypothetical protein